MIKSISLQNWKTHLDTKFEFSMGTNVIVGRMGSGKSAVMDAISFALYGTFPSQASHKVSLEETIMSKPIKQDKSIVRLEFDYNEKSYSVERTVKRNGINEGSLKENGKTIAGPKQTDVTKKITEILEVSYDLFSRAIYSEQNQMDYFLRLSPAQRKEKFDELLGLDKYELVRNNATTLSNRIKKTAEDKKLFIAEQRSKNDPREIEKMAKRIAEKENEMHEKSAALEKAEKECAEKQAIVKQLEQKEKGHKILFETELGAKSKLESFKAEINRMRQKLGGAQAGEIKSMLEKAAEKLAKISAEKKSAEKEISGAAKTVTELKEKRAAQKNSLDAKSIGMANAKSIGAGCPVCRKPMAGHDREKLEKELGEEKEKIQKEITTTEKLLEKALEESEGCEKNLRETEKQKELAQRDAESAKRLGEISSEIAEKEKSKAAIEKELAKIAEQLSKEKFDDLALAKEREQFYSLRERAAKNRAEINSAKELQKELADALRRIMETQEQIEKWEKECSELEKAAQKLAIFTSALKSTQGELRYAMIETINSAMDEIWQKIYPYGDYTTAKIMVEEGSYEIMARQLNGEWARVEGILSGGERSSVALTMRIAVSLVLTQNLGWIILDEPTHNLDANSVKELSETMRTHLPQIIGQVFIITHDKEMEYAASGKLYTLEREKEKDGVTRVEGG